MKHKNISIVHLKSNLLNITAINLNFEKYKVFIAVVFNRLFWAILPPCANNRQRSFEVSRSKAFFSIFELSNRAVDERLSALFESLCSAHICHFSFEMRKISDLKKAGLPRPASAIFFSVFKESYLSCLIVVIEFIFKVYIFKVF